jgi:hypothetical protein
LTDLDLLRGAPPAHLYAIAEARRLRLPGARPASAADLPLEEIARRLFHEPSLRESLRALEASEWAILRELARCGGQAPSYELRGYLLSAGVIRGSGHSPEAQVALYEHLLAQVLRLGLVFWGRVDMLGGREYASGAHDGLLVIPPSVLALLETLDPHPEASPPAGNLQPRAPLFASAELFQRDLYCYWRAVREQPAGLALMANGLLPKAALRSLNAALSLKNEIDDLRGEQEAGRLFFIRLLAQSLGLLAVQGEVLTAVAEPAFFSDSVAARTQQSFTAWLNGSFWNELLHLPGIMLRPTPPPLEAARPEVLRARQVVLNLLRGQPGSNWLSRAMLLAQARLRRSDLLFPQRRRGQGDVYTAAGNPFGWDFRPRGGWLSAHDAWLRVEGAFLAAVVEGPLHWLGAVDLDIPSPQHPLAYHLSAAGLALLGKGDWPPELTETTPGRVVVQPNFDVLALPPVRESLLLFLDQIAERDAFDQVAHYRLTRERWLSALQAGFSAADLIARLEQLAQAELPQNMRYSLLEWERQARRIHLHRDITVLEVEESALLDSLLADPTLAPLLRRITPTAALVDRQHLSHLSAALLEHGQLPRLIHPQ